jgi:hypothetical protein
MLAGIGASTAYARDPWDPETKVRRAEQSAATAVVLAKADLGLGWAGQGRSRVHVNVIAPSVQEPQLPGLGRRVARLLVDRVRA